MPKISEFVLIVSKDTSYVVNTKKDFHTKDGVILAKQFENKKFGDKIKTHLGKDFLILRPTIADILEKKVERGAQVILPKDIAIILAYTGVNSDSIAVDAGTGSGYLAIFLANFLSKGRVITYELRQDFFEKAKRNIQFSGLTNIEIKRGDVTKSIKEREVDLVTLDLQGAKDALKNAYDSLRIGGWLVIYSPTVEHLMGVLKELKRTGFSQTKTVENIVREWQVELTVRPKSIGIMHTGWLTFARKL